MQNNTNSLPDDAADLAAAATEGAPVSRVPQHVRDYAAVQLELAASFIKDCVPECEEWNLKEAATCVRAALRALAFGGK
jgi:hypothetical protein